jgi:hypothetical protein
MLKSVFVNPSLATSGWRRVSLYHFLALQLLEILLLNHHRPVLPPSPSLLEWLRATKLALRFIGYLRCMITLTTPLLTPESRAAANSLKKCFVHQVRGAVVEPRLLLDVVEITNFEGLCEASSICGLATDLNAP